MASISSTEATLSSPDMSNIDLDPSTLAASTSSLLATLESTSTKLSELRETANPPPQLDASASLCHQLYKSYGELEQVFLVYTKVWTPDDLDVDPPLDPKLVECIAACARTLREVQVSVECLRNGENKVAVSALDAARRELQEQVQVINEFLPIMKGDLDEFLEVARISKPTGPVGHQYLGAWEPEMQRRGSVQGLRQELYGLKDEIRKLTKALEDVISSKSKAANQFAESLVKVKQDAGTVYDGITEALTNHASEWIESLLGGRMTFNEFLRIDDTAIRTLSVELRKLRQRLIRDIWLDQNPDSLDRSSVSEQNGEDSGRLDAFTDFAEEFRKNFPDARDEDVDEDFNNALGAVIDASVGEAISMVHDDAQSSDDEKSIKDADTDGVLEAETSKYVQVEDEARFRCRMPECTKLFKGEVYWRKHVDKRHAEFVLRIKEDLNGAAQSRTSTKGTNQATRNWAEDAEQDLSKISIELEKLRKMFKIRDGSMTLPYRPANV